jgi:adenylate kinase family enzyme
MTKKLIILRGTMGVGKSTTARQLQKLIPRSVWLDGDWCWNANPFVVNEETKEMVIDNITHLLSNFLRCSAYQNIVFTWVLDDPATLIRITESLSCLPGYMANFNTYDIALTCSTSALEKRIRADIESGLRTEESIDQSLQRLPLYGNALIKMDISDITAEQAAMKIAAILGH